MAEIPVLVGMFDEAFDKFVKDRPNAHFINDIWGTTPNIFTGAVGPEPPATKIDDAHPNALGCKIMADNYFVAMKDVLIEAGFVKPEYTDWTKPTQYD
jgi:hypothetical protein